MTRWSTEQDAVAIIAEWDNRRVWVVTAIEVHWSPFIIFPFSGRQTARADTCKAKSHNPARDADHYYEYRLASALIEKMNRLTAREPAIGIVTSYDCVAAYVETNEPAGKGDATANSWPWMKPIYARVTTGDSRNVYILYRHKLNDNGSREKESRRRKGEWEERRQPGLQF